MSVRPTELPAHSLLRQVAREVGAYADCFVTDVPWAVTHAGFVEAFYTSGVFRIERLLISTLMSRPSTDGQARQLARGELDAFAAWTVEKRAPGQVLLADVSGRTRSWLMVESVEARGQASAFTRLYFGSAVMPARPTRRRKLAPRFVSHLMLSFHKLYSRILLRAAMAGTRPRE